MGSHDISGLGVANLSAWREFQAWSGSSSYTRAIAEFAQRWAKLMQAELARGKSLGEVWNDCSRMANEGLGVTGQMETTALVWLVRFWSHGQELKGVHNEFWGVSPDSSFIVDPYRVTLT